MGAYIRMCSAMQLDAYDTAQGLIDHHHLISRTMLCAGAKLQCKELYCTTMCVLGFFGIHICALVTCNYHCILHLVTSASMSNSVERSVEC